MSFHSVRSKIETGDIVNNTMYLQKSATQQILFQQRFQQIFKVGNMNRDSCNSNREKLASFSHGG